MSYLPMTDAGLLSWAQNFATQIGEAPDPMELGLSAQDVADYNLLSEDYATKYAAATHPNTRGGSTIQAKNSAKSALIAESRKLAMAVTRHPTVTDQQRYDMGLTVRDNQRTPVPPPDTSPVLDITSVDGWTVNLRLHAESGGRAKPADVTGAFVYTYVGETAPTDITAWHMEGTASRTHTKVVFPGSLEPGTKVWITAAWVNAKLQTGPACTPRSTQINFGGMSGGSTNLKLAA